MFNFFENQNEKNLYNSAITEMQNMYGIPLKYLRRTVVDMDELFGEDPNSQFNSAVDVKFYLETTSGFEGQGDFFSKFGLQVEDSATLITSMAYIEPLIGGAPLQGDLIYLPSADILFEIKNVEDDKGTFLTFGKNNTYSMTVETFKYSGEDLATGITQVDNLNSEFGNTDPSDNGAFDIDIPNTLTFNESDPFA